MIKLPVILSLFCLSAFFLGGCIDKVELTFPTDATTEGQVVVDGLITDGPGPYPIRIFRMTPLNSLLIQPVVILEAKVIRDDGPEEALIPGLEAGDYLLPGEIVKGEVGRRYQLSFTLDNGAQYQSQWEYMPPVGKIDSIYIEVTAESRHSGSGLVFRNFLDVYCDVDLTNLDPETPYMRWKTDRWWMQTEIPRSSPPSKSCYILETPNRQQVHLFDGRGVSADRWIKEPMAFTEANWKNYQKNWYLVIQYSLNEQAFGYWNRLDKVLEQSGSIFDSPPAAVVGNVQNVARPIEEVLGYFGASAMDTGFHTVYRQDIAFSFVQYVCNLPIRNSLYSGDPCQECLTIPNAIIERPYWW